MKLFLLLLLAVPSVAQLRINSGGAAYSDVLGVQWQADKYFVGGAVSTGAVPPNASQIYATKRYGDFYYLLPVPDGAYSVSLYFLENVVTAAGQRVFNVSINGAVVMSSFDPILSPGSTVPLKATFPATAEAGAGIKIQFSTIARSAFVNAVEVVPAVPAPAAPGIVSSQLLDFAVAYTSPSVLTIGAACSPTTPCLAGPHNTAYKVPFTVTLTGGSGVAFVYLDLAGNFSVAPSGLTLACSLGCLTPAGLTTWPDGSEKLWSCTATNGAWDPQGCSDWRVFLGAPRLPSAPAGSNLGRYVSPVQTGPDSTFSILGTTHQLAGQPCAFTLAVYDVSNPASWAAVPFASSGGPFVSGWWVNPATCDVVVSFGGAAGLSNYIVTIYGMTGTAAQLANLEVCSGSGPGWNCGGLLRASILKSDGSPLVLYGVADGIQAPSPLTTWTPVK